MARRIKIIRKQPVFVACEGKGEFNYVKFLNKLAHDNKFSVTFVPENVRGSTPLAQVKAAVKRLEATKGRRPSDELRFQMLDADQYSPASPKGQETIKLAKQHKITLIWRDPCHESFILNHFGNRPKRIPKSCAEAEKQLKKFWATYEKNIDANVYLANIDESHIRAARTVEPDFDNFLASIGWPD